MRELSLTCSQWRKAQLGLLCVRAIYTVSNPLAPIERVFSHLEIRGDFLRTPQMPLNCPSLYKGTIKTSFELNCKRSII